MGVPRLAELAPRDMRLKLRPYHLLTGDGSDLMGSAEGTPDEGGQPTDLHHFAGDSHKAHPFAGDEAASAIGQGKVASDETARAEDESPHYWSSVGRNFLLLFLPGSSSLYYGDEVDVTAPRDMKVPTA